MINIYTDGGARGNPGPSAIGVYILDSNNKVIDGFGKPIGFATNNVAEYKAVIEALSWLLEKKELLKNEKSVSFYLDSELVCKQLNGLYKIKNSDLRNLLFKIREKEAILSFEIKYFHVPRERNREADKLVNKALDNNTFVSYNSFDEEDCPSS